MRLIIDNFSGSILCRLEAGSEPLKALCKRLDDRQNSQGPQKSPFLVKESINEAHDHWHSVKKEIFENVDQGSPFQLNFTFKVHAKDDPTRIYLSLSENPTDQGVLISGFPSYVIQVRECEKPSGPSRKVHSVCGNSSNSSKAVPYVRNGARPASAAFSVNTAMYSTGPVTVRQVHNMRSMTPGPGQP